MNSQIQQKCSSRTIIPQVILISNGNIIQVALIIFQQELLRMQLRIGYRSALD